MTRWPTVLESSVCATPRLLSRSRSRSSRRRARQAGSCPDWESPRRERPGAGTARSSRARPRGRSARGPRQVSPGRGETARASGGVPWDSGSVPVCDRARSSPAPRVVRRASRAGAGRSSSDFSSRRSDASSGANRSRSIAVAAPRRLRAPAHRPRRARADNGGDRPGGGRRQAARLEFVERRRGCWCGQALGRCWATGASTQAGRGPRIRGASPALSSRACGRRSRERKPRSWLVQPRRGSVRWWWSCPPSIEG